MESGAAPDLVVAVLRRSTDAIQKGGEAHLSFRHRQAGQILAVDEQKIEEEEDKVVRIPGV